VIPNPEREFLWLCKDGKKIKVKDMRDSHIQNVISYFKRNPEYRPMISIDILKRELAYRDTSDYLAELLETATEKTEENNKKILESYFPSQEEENQDLDFDKEMKDVQFQQRNLDREKSRLFLSKNKYAYEQEKELKRKQEQLEAKRALLFGRKQEQNATKTTENSFKKIVTEVPIELNKRNQFLITNGIFLDKVWSYLYKVPEEPAIEESETKDVAQLKIGKEENVNPWVKYWPVIGTSGKEYKVSQRADGSYGCSCPAWTFQKQQPRKDCQHILLLRLKNGEGENQKNIIVDSNLSEEPKRKFRFEE
jgi:hypothetical protein